MESAPIMQEVHVYVPEVSKSEFASQFYPKIEQDEILVKDEVSEEENVDKPLQIEDKVKDEVKFEITEEIVVRERQDFVSNEFFQDHLKSTNDCTENHAKQAEMCVQVPSPPIDPNCRSSLLSLGDSPGALSELTEFCHAHLKTLIDFTITRAMQTEVSVQVSSSVGPDCQSELYSLNDFSGALPESAESNGHDERRSASGETFLPNQGCVDSSTSIQKYPIVSICKNELTCSQCIKKCESELLVTRDVTSPSSNSKCQVDIVISSDSDDDSVIGISSDSDEDSVPRYNQNAFTCTKCHASFESESTLMRHIKFHDLDKNVGSNFIPISGNFFCCAFCLGVQFQSKTDLLMHLNLHRPESERKLCPECNEEFKTHSQLWNHIVMHTGEPVCECKKCSYTCVSKLQYEEHIWYTHHSDRSGEDRKWDTVISKLTDNIGVPFFCTFCGAKCMLKIDVFIHIKCHHYGFNQLIEICPICGMNCFHYYNLREHVKTHLYEEVKKLKMNSAPSTREKKAKFDRSKHCGSCVRKISKTNVSIIDLTGNENDVTKPDRGLCCCEMGDVSLIRNMENLFSCIMCSKKFEFKVDLLIHQTYDRFKPHQNICPECGRVFNRISKLRPHVATHTGEKFYKCDPCHFTTIRRDDLRTHYSCFHKEPEEMLCQIGENKVIGSCHTKNGLEKSMCTSKEFIISLCPTPTSKIQDLECRICKTKFIHRSDLQKHMKERHNALYCPICFKGYTSKKQMKNHFLTAHGSEENDGSYKMRNEKSCSCETVDSYFIRNTEDLSSCAACSKTFEFKVDLLLHLYYGGSGPCKLICVECGKMCTSVWQLRTHIAVHTGEKFYKCDLCQFTCVQKNFLIKHNTIFHKDKTEVPCVRCKQKIIGICHTADRLQSSHCTSPQNSMNAYLTLTKKTAQRENQCPICRAGFIEKLCLDSHMKARHSVLYCQICSKVLTSKKSKKDHMLRYHSPDQNYICALCNDPFVGNMYFKRHLQKYHGLKRTDMITCKLCNKEMRSGTIFSHHATMHQEKKYVCKVCGVKFARNDYLLKHMLTHTKKRPHLCSHCGAKFSRSDNLKCHERKHILLGDQMKLKPAIWKRK